MLRYNEMIGRYKIRKIDLLSIHVEENVLKYITHSI